MRKHESVHDFHKHPRLCFVTKLAGKCLMYSNFSKTYFSFMLVFVILINIKH